MSVGEALLALAPECGSAHPDVQQVTSQSDGTATVRFGFVDSPVPGAELVTFTGTAKRTDGQWEVSRYTVDKVLLRQPSAAAPGDLAGRLGRRGRLMAAWSP